MNPTKYLHRHEQTGCVEWSYSQWHGFGWIFLGGGVPSMKDLDKLVPLYHRTSADGYYFTEPKALREATAKAVAQRCYQIAMNTPRVWDVNAPDPQYRISAAIAAEFGLEVRE